MPRKPIGDSPNPRLSIGLPKSTWQEIQAVADHEVRNKTDQTAYFIQLGLVAHKNGYRLKNGGLKKLEVSD